MTTNSFTPQEINLQIQPLPTYIDADGSFKINTPMLSTYNFDGLIPKKQEAISVTLVKPGYLIQINTGEDYYPVVSVEKDDIDLEITGFVTLNYINNLGNTASKEYVTTDTVNAIYEDWSEKILGSQGWGITAAGNAIFTNVAVRGRIEADEGYISGNLTIGAGGSETLNDLATTADLNGYIPDGAAAADIISNNTTITGGNIFTGTIQSQFYSYTSGLYSNNGMQIGLDGNGYIRSPNFYLDTSGNANFRGNIVARGGAFGEGTRAMSIVDDGTRVSINTTTLKIGSEYVNSVLHGSINFYNTSGVSQGSISSAASKKSTISLGDGITYGTDSDYIFLPSSTNTTRSRYLGSGFNWYDTGSNLLMSIGGGTGQLQIYRNTTVNTGYILTTNGITNGGGGITNNGGQITSLPTYSNNDAGLTANMHITSTGVFRRAGSTQRIKTNITPLNNVLLSSSVLEEKILNSSPTIDYKNILQLSPVEFSPIDQQEKRIFGFIAEDISDKIPEIATYDEDGVPDYYNINSIVAALLAVVQDQQKEINELQNKLNIIEERLGL